MDCEKITFPEGFSELEQKNLFCTPCAVLHNPRKNNTLPARGKHNLYIDNKISLILRLILFLFTSATKLKFPGSALSLLEIYDNLTFVFISFSVKGKAKNRIWTQIIKDWEALYFFRKFWKDRVQSNIWAKVFSYVKKYPNF